MTIDLPGKMPRLKRGWLWGGGAALLAALLSLVAWNVEYERVVAPQQLPAPAQSFLAEHYPGETPALAIRELDDLRITYEVIFRDGTQVKFRRNGTWYKIESPVRFVPAAVVPPRIAEYVAQNFPGMPVTEIEHRRGRYEVELADRIELTFDDKYFALREYDD